MGLLTEAALRDRLRGEDLSARKEFRVDWGTIVTPAARAFLSDHKIQLVEGDVSPEIPVAPSASPGDNKPNGNLPVFEKPGRYEGLGGGFYTEKPEHMTALRGNKLVNKDHPVIRFRGRMDSLMAQVLEARIALQKTGREDIAQDLGEVQAALGEILRCEVLNIPLEEAPLLGMTGDEIRARSHTPQKYYGLPHFAPEPEHGETVALLNALRTQAREVELDAYVAFRGETGVPARPDLLRALNRLSSLFYVMMFRARAGKGTGK